MQTTIFEELTDIKCCVCHAMFGMPVGTEKRYRESKKTFYCPYCQASQGFYGASGTEKELERVKRELEDQKLRTKWAEADAKRENRSKNAFRGQVTRMKNRHRVGVCLHCNRTFKQLAAHMRSKHPEEVAHG